VLNFLWVRTAEMLPQRSKLFPKQIRGIDFTKHYIFASFDIRFNWKHAVILFKHVIIELTIISQFQWASIFRAHIKAAALNRIVDYDCSWKDDYQDLWLHSRFYVQQHLDILTCIYTVSSMCFDLYAVLQCSIADFVNHTSVAGCVDYNEYTLLFSFTLLRSSLFWSWVL